jgi:DNA repair exonuclease SbcCD nuclease subunit
MKKFIVCADLHITEKMPYGATDRIEELLKAWGEVCLCATNHKIKDIVIAGDIFDDINVSPASLEIFSEMMRRSFDINKWVISGNHDIDECGRSIVKGISNLWMWPAYRSPIGSPSPWSSNYFIHSITANVDLIMFDFHRSYLDLQTNIDEAIEESNTQKRIFIGHQPIEGMEMSGSTVCINGMPKSWLTNKGIIGKNFDLVLMGDFHKRQKLKGSVEGYYVGNLIQHSFRDEGAIPSFTVVEIEGNEINVDMIDSRAPRFHTIRYIEGEADPDLKGITRKSYIRILVVGTQEYVNSIDTNKVHEKIVSLFNPIKILIPSPIITCSAPNLQGVSISRLMSDKELVEKIISTSNTDLPDKELYEVGIEYLDKAKQ